MTKQKKSSKNSIPPLNQFKLIQTSSLSTPTEFRSQNYSRPNYKPKPCYKLRSCLRGFFRYLCPSCCGAQHKHDLRNASHNSSSRKKKRGRIKTICCPPWNCFPFCCCIGPGGRQRGPAPDSSEDICNLIRNCGSGTDQDLDIDQYVARYRQSEQSQLPATKTTPATSAATAAADQFAMVASPSTPRAQSSQSSTPEVHKRGKKKIMKHIWNWNDSLKSNSDSFLESLEFDAVNGGGGGSKSNSLKKYRKINNCSYIEGTLAIFTFLGLS